MEADYLLQEARGPVKWFNLDRGFGFVVLDDGRGDAFLHVSVLRRDGVESVAERDVIRCEVSAGQKGIIVTKVLGVESCGEREGKFGFHPGPAITGTVKFFSRVGSYGFIALDNGDDIYMSRRCLSRSRVSAVVAGQRVSATTLVGGKGLVADRIVLLDDDIRG